MFASLGLPDVRAHRKFVSAIAIDAIGSGTFMPIAVLFFVRNTDLGMARVGTALSLAALIALPFVLVVGQLVDRFGSKRMLLLANVVQAVGMALYGLAHSFAAVVAVTALTSIGMSIFWASYSPFVATIAPENEREKWFGFLQALRNVGFAVGGLLSGLVVAVGTERAYSTLVWLNVASYVLSFLLLAGLTGGGPTPHEERSLAPWSVALRDKTFGVLVGVNLAYALSCLALNYAMPLYFVERLGMPGWLTGVVFTINTVMVGFGQSALVAQMTGYRRFRIIQAAQLALAGGFVLLAVAGYLPIIAGIVVAIIASTVYTLGEILAGPVLTAVAVGASPEATRGRYLAYYQLSWQASSIIAPALFAWLLTLGRVPIWLVLTALAGLAAAVIQRLAGHMPIAAARVTNGEDTDLP